MKEKVKFLYSIEFIVKSRLNVDWKAINCTKLQGHAISCSKNYVRPFSFSSINWHAHSLGVPGVWTHDHSSFIPSNLDQWVTPRSYGFADMNFLFQMPLHKSDYVDMTKKLRKSNIINEYNYSNLVSLLKKWDIWEISNEFQVCSSVKTKLSDNGSCDITIVMTS